jgi:hypothetical protein
MSLTMTSVNTQVKSFGRARRSATKANIVRVPKAPQDMGDDEIGRYCADGLAGVLRRAADLKPYFEDVWRRFSAGHTILECRTRTEYCDKVLNCSIRRVQQIIYGRTTEKPVAEEPDRNLNLFEDNSIITQAEPVSPTERMAQELTALLEGVFGKGMARAKSTCNGKLNWRVVRYDVFKVTLSLTEDRLCELAQRMAEAAGGTR